MIEHPFLSFDGDGRLQSDLRCIGCNYNLRSLRQADRCPECGSQVTATMAHLPLWGVTANLWTADPRWVQRLRRGFRRWCAYTLAGAMLLLALSIASQFVFFSGMAFAWHLLLTLVWGAPWMLICLGAWQATVGPRHEAQSYAWRIGRWVCRLSAVARMLLWMAIGFSILTDQPGWMYFGRYQTTNVVLVAALGVELVAWWSLLLYFRPLVRTLLPTAMSLWALAVMCGCVATAAATAASAFTVADSYYYSMYGYGVYGYGPYAWLNEWAQLAVSAAIPLGVITGFLWLAWVYGVAWMLWRTLRRFRKVDT